MNNHNPKNSIFKKDNRNSVLIFQSPRDIKQMDWN